MFKFFLIIFGITLFVLSTIVGGATGVFGVLLLLRYVDQVVLTVAGAIFANILLLMLVLKI